MKQLKAYVGEFLFQNGLDFPDLQLIADSLIYIEKPICKLPEPTTWWIDTIVVLYQSLQFPYPEQATEIVLSYFSTYFRRGI